MLPPNANPPDAVACVASRAETSVFNLPPSGPSQPAEALSPGGELTTETVSQLPRLQAKPSSDGSAPAGASSPSPARQARFTATDLHIGNQRLNLLRPARELLAEGHGWREIGSRLGTDWQKLRKWHLSVVAIPTELLTAEDLARRTSLCGRKRQHNLTEAERKAVKKLHGQINRTRTDGSVPYALKVAAKRGELRPETVALLQSREADGLPLVTEATAHELRNSEAAIRSLRTPRNAWLDYVSSPGSLMLTVDPATGQERMIQPGEVWTMDDATKNFACWVQLEKPGDKCWEKHGCIVGRFQWLVVVDHRTGFILAHTHTARPRGSYRAEDLVAALQIAVCQHGRPARMVLEKGVSAATLVTETLRLLDVGIERASSPHQKVVEGVFNRLWTKLSLMPGQVGRFMGDDEETSRLIQSCRSGSRDPRKHFPSLPATLKALNEAVAEHNADMVRSTRYGDWRPADFYAAEAHKHTRMMPEQDAWMFSPVVKGPLTVRGCQIETTVRLTEEHSTKFVFNSPDLFDFHGALVRLHFNPLAPNCTAKVVLAEDFRGHRAGALLGNAEQVDRFARFNRRLFGYSDEQDIGRQATKQAAQSLRRHGAALKADGTLGAQVAEARDGLGNASIVERGISSLAPQTPDPRPQTPLASAPTRLLAIRPTAVEQQRARNTFATLARKSREMAAVT